RAEGEDCRVGGWGADEITADADTAGNNEQRKQQNDEGEVVDQQRVQDFGQGRLRTEGDGARKNEDKCPDARDLAEMTVPEMWAEQWEQRNREEKPGEGDPPEETERAPVETRCIGDRASRAGKPIGHAASSPIHG